MSNKQTFSQFGDRKWITEQVKSVCYKKQKPPRDSNSGSTDHSPGDLFTRLWSDLIIAVDKILLLNEMSVRLEVSHFVMVCYSTWSVLKTKDVVLANVDFLLLLVYVVTVCRHVTTG